MAVTNTPQKHKTPKPNQSAILQRRQSSATRSAKGRYLQTNFVNDEFLSTEGALQFWYIGLMAADGCILKNQYVTLSQSGECGLELIEFVQKAIGYIGATTRTSTTHQDSHSCIFASPRIVEKLAEYGVVRNKTLTYQFPSNLPEKWTPAFLRGYFEGDGSAGIYWYGKTHSLCASLVGTEDFIKVCQTKIPVSSHMIHIKRVANLYELRWTGQRAEEFGEWLWQDADLYEGRKKQIFIDFATNYTPKYRTYGPLKIKALSLLNEGVPAMEVAKQIGVAFQTVYDWKKQANRGLLE